MREKSNVIRDLNFDYVSDSKPRAHCVHITE